MHDTILITKATGEREAFDPQKLRNSLQKAKASELIVDKILSHIELELKDGMSTKEIYHHAFDLLFDSLHLFFERLQIFDELCTDCGVSSLGTRCFAAAC
jgi:transcriptional regulator NrdR family protein